MQKNLTIIELTKPYLEFSAGHFTIFSATKREKMHGHNFNLHAEIEAEVSENGMAFDYAIYKKKLLELCKKLNGYFLLPSESPYFKIEQDEKYYYGIFNDEKIPFLKHDVIILPLRNITIEELARWFLEQLIQDQNDIKKYLIHAITIKVFSAPGQGAQTNWRRT
jgi:6-pyruvoyltetrahydropterin/6-carboxytetrahydropterin synthase